MGTSGPTALGRATSQGPSVCMYNVRMRNVRQIVVLSVNEY